MLSVTDLLSIKTKPHKKDVSLLTIQDFYKEHLCGRIFVFELEDQQRPIIKIRFEESNFCHLIGFQHIFKGQKNARQYEGQTGYDLVKNSTVTFETLNDKATRSEFKNQRNRMLYLPFVSQILKTPTVVVFSKSKVKRKTNLNVDLIIYNYMDNKYLHLGLDKDGADDFYYPKTFFERNDEDFIDDQTELKIKSFKVEID